MTAQRALPTTSNYQLAEVTAPAVAPSIEYRSLPDNDGATFMTLDAMKDAVLGRLGPDYSGYLDSDNIRAALSICSRSLDHTHRGNITALFNWVISNITYLEHPFNTQVVQDAKRTIQIGSGDCVSLSVLLATLAGCLGYQSQFIAQWVDGESASHVYLEVFLPDGQTIALDPVAKDQPLGWRQPTLDGGFEVAWEIFNV